MECFDRNNSGLVGWNSRQTYTNRNFLFPYDGTDTANNHYIPTQLNAPFVDLYLSKIIDFESKGNENEGLLGNITSSTYYVPRSNVFKDIFFHYETATDDQKKEGYSKIASFLVMIPENINNKWTYDIIAEPKTSIFEVMDLTIRKVWNNTILEITDKVTVSLLKGEDVIETVELNPDNNWTYTFENIEKSDDYSVLEVNVPTGYVATYQENNNIFTITNTDKLVQTGQNKILLLSLAIIGLILLIVGLLFEKRKKYE